MGYSGGVGAACSAIAAPRFGSQACRVAELVSPMQFGAVMLRLWGCWGLDAGLVGEL